MPDPKYLGLPHPKASEKRKLNNKNGSDAEVYAGALLMMASGGEISWGSREEDGSKIDLLLSFPNQWGDRGRRILLAQVKSGPSYGKTIQENGSTKAELYKKVFEDSFSATNDTILLWVNRKKNLCFWTYVIRGQKPAKKTLTARQQISPALKYDIARITGSRQKDGGKGLVFSTKSIPFKTLRAEAQEHYRNHAKQTIVSPLFGPVELTKSGWRHMSRASRSKQFKQSSYEIMKWLPNIIGRTPDYHEVQDYNSCTRGEWSYRDTVYTLVYSGIECQSNPASREPVTVYLKIEESMVYPRDWQQTVQRLQLVERRCKLLSVYYK